MRRRPRSAPAIFVVGILALTAVHPVGASARDPEPTPTSTATADGSDKPAPEATDSSSSGPQLLAGGTCQRYAPDSEAICTDGPLTRVEITSDLNCAVNHVADADDEFFDDTACATLLAVDGTLYGPSSIPAGGNAAPRTAFTPVSQSEVTGSGSAADPYTIVTVVDAGPSGIRLTQTDTYVVGREAYRTEVEVAKLSAGVDEVVLYHAADCYLQNDDYGFGRADAVAGSVSCVSAVQGGGGFEPGDRVIQWLPLDSGSHYMEARYADVWAQIGSQADLPDTVDETYHDSGAGLSWRLIVPEGTSTSQAHYTTFSPNLVDVQACELEEWIELPPPPDLTPAITIRYDPRFIVPEDRHGFEALASQVAEAIQTRAREALIEYAALVGDDNVPDHQTIELTCDVEARFGPIVVNELETFPAGFTEGATKVKIRSDFVRREFKDAVQHGFPAEWTNQSGWVNLVDHEEWHAVQLFAYGILGGLFGNIALGLEYDSNATVIESGAVTAQDLLADADDLPQPPGGFPGSYRFEVEQFFANKPSIDARAAAYQAAAVFEYWGERYGPGDAATLEERVARFLRGRIVGGGTGPRAMDAVVAGDV